MIEYYYQTHLPDQVGISDQSEGKSGYSVESSIKAFDN